MPETKRAAASHDNLMEALLSPANLKQAWRRMKANRGAPGIAGLRIEDFPAHSGQQRTLSRNL